jgi:hypothetical protein
MGVQVDEPGCDDPAPRVDTRRVDPELRLDGGDPIPLNADVGSERRASGTVDDLPIGED